MLMERGEQANVYCLRQWRHLLAATVSTHQNTAVCVPRAQLSNARVHSQLHFAVCIMSSYPEFFEVVGPCEMWPDEILEAFVQDVCSDSVKTIALFCHKSGVSRELLRRVMMELPFGPAPENYVEYALGLYEMWSSARREDSAIPVSDSEPSTSTRVVRQVGDLEWCLPLEKFAGPIVNWPDDILEAFRGEQNYETARPIAEWGYFHSVPLDDLTDVLMSQRGATGDISHTAFLSIVYSEMFYTEAGLSSVLDLTVSPEPEVPETAVPVVIQLPDVHDNPESPPLITIVDLGEDEVSQTQEHTQQSPSWLLSGPDLSKPEVLGRLGEDYVRYTLAREDHDPFDAAWKAMLRRLGAPRAWPLDIRQCLAGRVDEQNAIVVASFAYMNRVEMRELLEYLQGRPQGLDSATAGKIRIYYEMWNNPKRGYQYRQQRFAYNIELKRYLDLNLCESENPVAIAKNKILK